MSIAAFLVLDMLQRRRREDEDRSRELASRKYPPAVVPQETCCNTTIEMQTVDMTKWTFPEAEKCPQ